MPDPTPNLVALADQVKFLSGDLNRRFELLNSRIDELNDGITQLNSRIDTLSISRKVALPFKPALGGDWLEGATSPQIISSGPSGPVRRGGSMSVVLPNLCRIGVFRASVRISGTLLSGEGTLIISLIRQDINGNNDEIVVGLSSPLVPGIADPHGDPIPGTEFVDNDRFKYLISAVLVISGLGPPLDLQPGMAVLESFEIECIVA
jgi:hypothetical protein